MSEKLLLTGIVIAALSGLPGLFFGRTSMRGQWLTTLLAVLAAMVGLGGIGIFWVTGDNQPIVLPWSIPGGEFHVAVDGLSAMFLLPILLVSLLGNVYGLAYWKQTDHPQNGRKLRLYFGTLTAGMALLVIARNSILFLFGWEIMALSAFFLVTTEGHKQEVREAGWIYLVAAHVATLCLFAMFALLHSASGSFAMAPLEHLPRDTATAIFVLALVGFGLKAGIMPLHVWLPSSHAIAPSHVSAVMSGVIIKMGIYGLLRITSLLPTPSELGAVVLGLGVLSGVLGVAFAIGQHDLKRLLAYHSIENIGIIIIGVGLALMGRSANRSDWIILGLSGALLHVWNHAFFKALLFLCAGSVIQATHTREIDQLGGLAKIMPWTSLYFLVGAVAICGLPPLNGFVSELLIYLGLFNTLLGADGSWLVGAALAAPALALIGALAVACFVKVYGAVFLGMPHSEHMPPAHEAPLSMLGPMGVLAICCFMIGLAPLLVVPMLARAVTDWAPNVTDVSLRLATLAPLQWITFLGLLLIAALSLAGKLLRSRLHSGLVAKGATWGCGYVKPTARMQYTSSSFAQMLVGLFAWALRPRTREPNIASPFPQETAFHSEVPDVVLDQAVLPTFRFWAWLFTRFRVFQRGSIQAYLLYIFVALIVLLLCARRNVMNAIFQNTIHILLALTMPPLVLGVITKIKALFAGRVGPPLLQPYYDLVKLVQKGSVFSTTTTWVFRAGPVVGLATTLIAALMIPLTDSSAPISFTGDFILFAYLLGLGRFFTSVAALDTGSAFEGMGAAREVTFACLGEPALFLGLLVLAKLTGSLQLATLAGSSLAAHWPTAAASLALVSLSWFIILLAENSRIPFDDPNTHLELTMIHEVMVLDHSGPALGMILYGAALKLFLFTALVVRVACPLATGNPWLDWPIFVGGILAVAVLIGIVESSMARLRLTHVPLLLVAACLLSTFGIVLLMR